MFAPDIDHAFPVVQTLEVQCQPVWLEDNEITTAHRFHKYNVEVHDVDGRRLSLDAR